MKQIVIGWLSANGNQCSWNEFQGFSGITATFQRGGWKIMTSLR